MKVDKTSATLVASMGGVLIGGTAVGVLLLSGSGPAHTPSPVQQKIQPAAEQASTSPAAPSTSIAVSSTHVTVKAPATTKAVPQVKAAPQTQETPVTDPSTDAPTTPPPDSPSVDTRHGLPIGSGNGDNVGIGYPDATLSPSSTTG